MAFTDEVDKWLGSTPKNHFPFEIEKLDTRATLEEIERQIKASRATLQRLEQMKKELAQLSEGTRRSNPVSKGTAA